MSCCPAGSTGAPPIQGYSWIDKGVVDKISPIHGSSCQELDVYRVGTSNRCIIWCYDIYGFEGGRTREMCDKLAAAGYMVLLPDFFRGQWRGVEAPDLGDWITKQADWFGQRQAEWAEVILPYARSYGAVTFGAVGTCMGAYSVMRLCSYGEFKAGASIHPATTFVTTQLLKEDLYEVLDEVGCPQLILAAGNDHQNEKKGGLAEKVWSVMKFGSKCVYREFPDMVHGWFTRGDTRDEAINNVSKATLNSIIGFFDAHIH